MAGFYTSSKNLSKNKKKLIFLGFLPLSSKSSFKKQNNLNFFVFFKVTTKENKKK